FCERLGWLDLRQERLRKSDHLNPLVDHDDLARVAADCGFTIERVTYYTPIVGAFVENVLMRMGEKALMRRAQRASGAAAVPDEARRAARQAAQARVRRGGAIYSGLMMLTWLMKLDVLAFGRFRSGPFFALLRKTATVAVERRG